MVSLTISQMLHYLLGETHHSMRTPLGSSAESQTMFVNEAICFFLTVYIKAIGGTLCPQKTIINHHVHSIVVGRSLKKLWILLA